MAGTAFGLPQLLSLYDPSVAVDQTALERQMALAQAIRQQALTPINTQGRQIGGMGYRISPLEGVAKVLQAYQANRMDQQNDAARLDLMQRMGQAYAAALRGGDPGAAPSGVATQAPAQAADASAPAGSAPATAPSPAPSAPGGMGMNDLVRGAIVNDIGGPAMGAAYAKNFEPTDFARALRTAGIDPNSTLGHQLAQNNIAKQNYIAPTSARPGGFLSEPGGNIVNLPQTQPGFVSVQDPSSPTGFRTVEQPGGLSSIGAAAGAKVGGEEAARAPYEFHEVTTGAGAKVPVSTQQLMAGALRSSAPANSGVATVTVTQPSKQAQAGPQDPWATVPKLQMPGGIGQTTYDAERQHESGQLSIDLAKKYGEAATAANQRIALNNQALGLVDQSDTGPGAARIADVKNILVSRFNVPESDFDNTPSATTALQKDLLNSAVQRAKQQFGARITQQEVMLMLSKGAPNVDMPKAAIKYLINSDNAMNQYAIQQANDFGRYTNSGGDPTQFDAWYSRAFPANNAIAGVHLDTGKKGPAQAPQKTVVRTGTYQGKKVVQYSDGTVDYAP